VDNREFQANDRSFAPQIINKKRGGDKCLPLRDMPYKSGIKFSEVNILFILGDAEEYLLRINAFWVVKVISCGVSVRSNVVINIRIPAD
jgi:hypothetical protein